MKKRELRPQIVETEETKAEPRPEQPRELDGDELKTVSGGGGTAWSGGGSFWTGFTEGGGG